MEKAEFDRKAAEINSHPLTDYIDLTRSKSGMYCCPICGSGTGKNKTGALKIYKDTNRVRCYAGGCFTDKGEDTLGALCRIWGLGAVDVMRRLRLDDDAGRARPAPKKAPARPAEPPAVEDYSAKYKAWHDALLKAPAALEYLKQRGITLDAVNALNLGYDPNLGYGEKQSCRAPRIIIPYDAHYYKARRIDGNDAEAKYIPSAGGKYIYNGSAALEDKTDPFPVVVVEGELDAVAIYQGGYKRVVALGSTGNKATLVDQAKQLNPAAVFILALDNDAEDSNPKKSRAGQRAQAELAGLMDAAGIEYISADTGALYGAHKDAAEANLKDKAGFYARLMQLVDQGYNQRKLRDQQARIEAYFRSGPGMVDQFLHDVRGERYKPLPTGIQDIDRAIGGGLYRQTVTILGAAPGAGKTTLASQICESIAKAGTADVLFINLEMSREQLLARSLARIAYLAGNKGLTTTEILRGYAWTMEAEEAILDAAAEYKDTIAPHLIYNPGDTSADLADIMKQIHDEEKRLGHAPIVCIDYIQLLNSYTRDGRPEDSATTIKRAMQELKQYAIQKNTACILITANNRESVKAGESDITSGRDTSNIEYGADLHLGLVYTAVNAGTATMKEISAAKRAYLKNPDSPAAAARFEEICARRTLQVNKNRFGADDLCATLHFNGAAALFIPEETRHDDPPPQRRRL